MPFPKFHFLTSYDAENPISPKENYKGQNSKINQKPFNFITYKKQGRLFLFSPYSLPRALDENILVSVPFLGRGYFTYRKLGKNISYYSNHGEELWSKPFSSYPVSDYYGKMLLLINSDGTKVDLLDTNGVPLGVQSIHGSFLTDYDFATETTAVSLIFSLGEVYWIGSRGEVGFEYIFESSNETLFLKSCSLSPDGKEMSVHFQKGKKDYIAVLEKNHSSQKADLIFQKALPRVYPHILHTALNSHGITVAAPDRIFFFSLKKGKDWSRKITKDNLVYRSVHTGKDYFIFGTQKNWYLLDNKGRKLLEGISVASLGENWRFLPSGTKEGFAVHSAERIDYYQFNY